MEILDPEVLNGDILDNYKMFKFVCSEKKRKEKRMIFTSAHNNYWFVHILYTEAVSL